MSFLFVPTLVFTQWMLFHIWLGSANTTQYITLEGAGSPLPMSLYLNAIFSLRFVKPSVQVTFVSKTPDQTLCSLTNSSTGCAGLDWGSLVSPLTSDAYKQFPDLQMYPTVGGAVVPIYNLNGVTSLVLNMETLAKIWSGCITTWDHPDIQATNPNFTSWNIPVNQPIALVARGESAGATQVFKQALAGIDPLFRAQVGTSPDPTWNGTRVVFEVGSQLVVSHVLRNWYTLGYAPMGDALVNQLPMAKLNRSGTIVEASATSVQYAMMEKGLSFGDNGDDPAHLTGDIFNAVNPLAWPIASYSYLAVRKSTLRRGATCGTVSAMVDFWLWFWNSDEASSLAIELGFSMLPPVVRKQVVARFQQDIKCGGSVVWQETQVSVIVGSGPGSSVIIFNKFQQAYALVNSSVALSYSSTSDQANFTPLLNAGEFVVSATPLSSSANVFSLVLAAQALVATSQFILTLDGLTLAKILNGDIQTWLHPDIVALNPTGIRDSKGSAITNTTQRIVLLQGPTASSAPMTALLQQYYPAYTGAAILLAERINDTVLLWSAVLGTPYSFSVSALVGQLPEELQLASIVSGNGVAVAPTLTTAKACATNAAYSNKTNSVTLSLTNESCYPLLLPLYISLQRQCPKPPSTARAVTFLQWMFSEATLDAALESLNLVSLDSVSNSIQAANQEALFQLACGVHPTPSTPTDIVPLLLAVIIPIAAVVLTGVAACGWWLWRVTEHNRVMRKKFSNDNVAESCAEAIARFDLVAVAWLKEVKEPNKIQQAFLAIVTLLTEVKPYIPDQLLSQLTTSKSNERCAEEDNGLEPRSSMSSSVARDGIRRSFGESPRRERLSTSLNTPRSFVPPSPGSVRRVQKTSKSMAITSSDWNRKRCTYMCVRFGSTYQHPDKRVLGLAQVAGRIVDIAKANGATIDSVGVNFVNVHWGATASSGASAVRAVQAGLEMGQLGDTLPEDQQAAFWVQMGIGKGLCDCGTVSSESGHRFFVVWGPEASLALEVAMTNLPKRVLTSLLVSPAVHQEVQFTVQCMPRMWHGETLLWEPLCVMKKEGDDEWMYELKKMNEGASLSHQTLLEAFLLARNNTASASALADHVAQLQSHHGREMSAQDTAALKLLLAEARTGFNHTWELTVDDTES